jgi:hypothetical protein
MTSNKCLKAMEEKAQLKEEAKKEMSIGRRRRNK